MKKFSPLPPALISVPSEVETNVVTVFFFPPAVGQWLSIDSVCAVAENRPSQVGVPVWRREGGASLQQR